MKFSSIIKNSYFFAIGILALLLYSINLVFWVSVLFLTALLRFLIPIPHFQKRVYGWMQKLPSFWIDGHDWIIKLTTRTEWKIEGLENLSDKEWYFLVANHQSWADILILEKVFNRKVSTLKFFLKKPLIWLPFAGQACWLLDFPFMERATKNKLKTNPQKRGKDAESVRKACEIFKRSPSTVINFLEGTRFSEEKHKKQGSPYRHLLKPKSSGLAVALSVLDGYVTQLIDVTIVYPTAPVSAWDFFSSQMKTIVVKVRVLPIPEPFRHPFVEDRAARAAFQQWINQLWEEKDQWIEGRKR
jgi:1-acyl-sn-glycerol-3-phosphate acyltransferase